VERTFLVILGERLFMAASRGDECREGKLAA
jgi:hypothetical protein